MGVRITRVRKEKFHYIKYLLAILALSVIAFYSARQAMVPALGLDQSTRCGAVEHLHGKDCYDSEGILLCQELEHVHSQHCYLLLLEENNINVLLEEIDSREEKTLENVLSGVVNEAISLNRRTEQTEKQNVTPAEPKQQGSHTAQQLVQQTSTQSGDYVAKLNSAITQYAIQPSLVLNENLETEVEETESLSGAEVIASVLATAGKEETAEPVTQPVLQPEEEVTTPPQLQETEPVQLVAPVNPIKTEKETVRVDADIDPALLSYSLYSSVTSMAANSGVQLMSVGDTPITTGRVANFYANLDGSWVCIGTMDYTVYNRYRTLGTSDMLDMINTSLGTGLTTSDFVLRYATSVNGNYNSSASIGSNNTTFGRNNTSSPFYVRLMRNNYNPLYLYSVRFDYPNGNTETRYVRSGTAVTMPSGNYSWSDGSDTYYAGESVTVSGATVFTATELAPPTWLEINYHVNFPTVSGVTVSTRPTIAGTASTTVSDSLSEGVGTTIRNVSEQEVWGKVNGNSAGLSRVVRFAGWQVGDSDVLLKPNTRLSWSELLPYAAGNYITLTAKWEYDARQTASFYIRYDSVAVDSGGNVTDQSSDLYTPELFATYVGSATNYNWSENNTRYSITDTTADNSYGADQAIRKLYGEKPEGVWLQSFPSDDYIFELLKNYANKLSVNGVPVDVNDLNENGYAIRWYVLKSQSDAWHIDGKLVRKEGIFRISKTFAGNKEVISASKDGFSIQAHCDEDDTVEILTMDNYETYDAATDTYTWIVDGADYGEQWTFTDNPAVENDTSETDYRCYSEYIITDAIGDQSTDGAVQGKTFTINAMTYAPDTGKDEAMELSFTNIYYKANSIILKKQDARTGTSIGGARFCLLQNGKLMSFAYDAEAESYVYDPAGTVTEMEGTSAGYYEILIDRFSYDAGNIIVRETAAPEGYTPVGDVEIGYTDGAKTQIGMISESPMASYRDGVLIISNSTDTTSVTVEKKWDCPATEWRDVTVQLLANGRLVTTLLPGVPPTAVLTEDNVYTYTWSDLPSYANGAPIVWSVRETRIGTERCKEDYTFANWVVDYSLPVYTYNDDGVVINTKLTVTNDTRRTMLRLTKTDIADTVQLPGATFTLQLLLEDGTADTSFIQRTATTGEDGTLLFDNLLYGRYVLTETEEPAGYMLLPEPIYLTIEESGTVTVEETIYAKPGNSAFHIVVKNDPAKPLPNSGGGGTSRWYVTGGLLMAASLLYIALPRKRRCRLS